LNATAGLLTAGRFPTGRRSVTDQSAVCGSDRAVRGRARRVLGDRASGHEPPRPRSAIEVYLRQVEPIRLAVNRLLGQADPILAAYHDHDASPAETGRRMGRLERRFAAYAVAVAAIEPATAELRVLQAEYAHTYVLEDAYLSALAVGLADRRLDGLPDTQAAQRASIIDWRTGLSVLAHRVGVRLPADLQQAGRGEIAPSPEGS
jgi:hypothetical protein